MERRKHSRLSLGLPVSFSGHSATGSGEAVDLSMVGCKVESDSVPQNGDFLEVTLSHPDLDSPLTIDSAVVRWVKGEVFGLEFVHISAEATNGLGSLIRTVRTQPIRREGDRQPARPVPGQAKRKKGRKRPRVVWAIMMLYAAFAAVSAAAFAHLRAEAFSFTAGQEAFVSHLSSTDIIWALLGGVVGLLAAIRLVQLKADAPKLFLILLGISLGNGVWYAFNSEGLAYLQSMPGELIARLIGLGWIFATWAYAYVLKLTRVLT